MARVWRRLEIAAWTALILVILLGGIGLWGQLGRELAAGSLQGDFGCYYVTARLMLRDAASTYDGAACRALGEELGLGGTALFCPCLRYPPLFIWLLLPLARLPYGQAVFLWTALNALLFALLLAGGVVLLRRELGRWRWLLPFSLVLPPFVYTLFIGQVNVLLLLFLLPAMLARPHRSTRGQILVGIGLALAIHLKAVWGLLVLFLLLRRRFWAAGTAVLLTLLLWGVDLALLGPAFIPGYLASLSAGDQVNRLLISGLDGSLWGAAVALFGLYNPTPPAGWNAPAGYLPLQPLLAPIPALALLLPALGSLAMLGLSLCPRPPAEIGPAEGIPLSPIRRAWAWLRAACREHPPAADALWDPTGLLAVAFVMTATPHSGNHAVLLLWPAFLALARRGPRLGVGQRLLGWIAAATLLPTTLWLNLNTLAQPLAWTALPLMAGRVCLWSLLRLKYPLDKYGIIETNPGHKERNPSLSFG